MISKCIAFLVAALVLANCCASGSGCGVTPGGPVAWDGLGSAPTEETRAIEPRPNKMRAKKEIVSGPLDAAEPQQDSKVQTRTTWEQQQAANQSEDMRLRRKLTICRNCIAPEPNREETTASVAR
jgi:hypothetical protein